MARDFPDEELMERIAETTEPEERRTAPSCLKAKIYSALMLRQAETGPLIGLTEVKAGKIPDALSPFKGYWESLKPGSKLEMIQEFSGLARLHFSN